MPEARVRCRVPGLQAADVAVRHAGEQLGPEAGRGAQAASLAGGCGGSLVRAALSVHQPALLSISRCVRYLSGCSIGPFDCWVFWSVKTSV